MDETTLLDLDSNTDRPDWQDTRLAELVLHLTGCSAEEALLAIADPAPDVPVRTDAQLDSDEALERVARAILRIRKVRDARDDGVRDAHEDADTDDAASADVES